MNIEPVTMYLCNNFYVLLFGNKSNPVVHLHIMKYLMENSAVKKVISHPVVHNLITTNSYTGKKLKLPFVETYYITKMKKTVCFEMETGTVSI